MFSHGFGVATFASDRAFSAGLRLEAHIILETHTNAELQCAESALLNFPWRCTLAFNNEAPGAGQASQQFALPSYAGFPENGRAIRWLISFATAPTAVNIQLQTAINDVDGQMRCQLGPRT